MNKKEQKKHVKQNKPRSCVNETYMFRDLNQRKSCILVLSGLLAMGFILGIFLGPIITITTERQYFTVPPVLHLLSQDASTEDIIAKLRENPELLTTYYPNFPEPRNSPDYSRSGVYGLQDPLVIALRNERPKVAEYMIKHGASVQRSKKIIKAASKRKISSARAQEDWELLQKILREIESKKSQTVPEQ